MRPRKPVGSWYYSIGCASGRNPRTLLPSLEGYEQKVELATWNQAFLSLRRSANSLRRQKSDQREQIELEIMQGCAMIKKPMLTMGKESG